MLFYAIECHLLHELVHLQEPIVAFDITIYNLSNVNETCLPLKVEPHFNLISRDIAFLIYTPSATLKLLNLNLAMHPNKGTL